MISATSAGTVLPSPKLQDGLPERYCRCSLAPRVRIWLMVRVAAAWLNSALRSRKKAAANVGAALVGFCHGSTRSAARVRRRKAGMSRPSPSPWIAGAAGAALAGCKSIAGAPGNR